MELSDDLESVYIQRTRPNDPEYKGTKYYTGTAFARPVRLVVGEQKVNGHMRRAFVVGAAITLVALITGGCGKATCQTKKGFLGATRRDVLIDLLKVGLDDPDGLAEFCKKHEDTVYTFAEPEECVILERRKSMILCVRPKGKDTEVWTIEPWVEIE